MNNALEIEHLSKYYDSTIAIEDISFTVPMGSIFGLLGPNGAGKTSLLRIINKISLKDKGSVSLFGKDIQETDTTQIGYLPEERGLYKKMKVIDQVMYFGQLKGLSKKEVYLRITDWAERLNMKHWTNKTIAELSKGMSQKVQFICSVIHEPKLLILDEPFSGFDPINTESIKAEIFRLKSKGVSIILSTHNMASVEEICDNIVLINKGKNILKGRVDQIKENYKKNFYQIQCKGDIDILSKQSALCEIIDTKTVLENQYRISIQLKKGITITDILKNVIQTLEITEVSDIKPSMHDIFIDCINP